MTYPTFAEVVDLKTMGSPVARDTRLLRGRSFLVAWSEGNGELPIDSPDEYFLLLPSTGARLEYSGGALDVPGHSVVVMPRGQSDARLAAAGVCVRLFARVPPALAGVAVHGGSVAGEPPLRPIVPLRRRVPTNAPIVYRLDQHPNSAGMPRAKLFQTETMSINWVEYLGPRDRGNLSPHAHTDFEQGSLAIEGAFVQHLRDPWGKSADHWRSDAHLAAGPGTVTLIPPPVIHTTEGIGPGRHILIDIFAPPRADFIARGQVLNASEYEAL